MKRFFFLAFVAMGILNTNAQGSAVYTQMDVECMGVEMDGSQTLRVSGFGKLRKDSREQCRKNAVWAVIFNGITKGTAGCNTRPLITEVNAQERYEDYFNAFFKDGGPFEEFASYADKKMGSTERYIGKKGTTRYMTVRVLRAELKARLKKDGILKQ